MVLMSNSFELHLNPNAIFDMTTGFWISKTLMCAVGLEVFIKLSGKSLTMDEIQKLLDFQNRHTEAFITALVSFGLLTSIKRKENGKSLLFTNSRPADTFLVRGEVSLHRGFYYYV